MSLSAVLQAGYRVIRFPYLLSPSNMVKKETRDVIHTTGVEWVYRTDANQKSSDLCFNAAEYLISKDNIDKREHRRLGCIDCDS